MDTIIRSDSDSFSKDLRIQQDVINKLLVQLEGKSQDGRLADDLKENITDLIDQLSGNHGGIQGDLVALMKSFRNGKVTAEELEMMITHESARSHFLLTESIDMKNVMKGLFAQFEQLVNKIDASDPAASAGIDSMQSSMNDLLGSISLLTTGIVTSGSDIHRVISSKSIKTMLYDNQFKKKEIVARGRDSNTNSFDAKINSPKDISKNRKDSISPYILDPRIDLSAQSHDAYSKGSPDDSMRANQSKLFVRKNSKIVKNIPGRSMSKANIEILPNRGGSVSTKSDILASLAASLEDEPKGGKTNVFLCQHVS
jgi:hypothetical protein